MMVITEFSRAKRPDIWGCAFPRNGIPDRFTLAG